MTEYAQFCALARAAEVVGERWTLLIFRELYLGPKRYSDLLERLEPIAPGVLNGRLKSLEAKGLIARREVAPPTPARLFELTEGGRALEPALFELLRWGARYLFPQRQGERFEADWLRMVLLAYAKPGAAESVTLALRVAEDTQGRTVWLQGGPEGLRVEPHGEAADATITGPVTALMGLMSGRLSVADGIQRGTVQVEGDLDAAEAMERMFERR